MQDRNSNYFENQFYRFAISKPNNWYRLNSTQVFDCYLRIAAPIKSYDKRHDEIIPYFAFMKNQCDINTCQFGTHIIGIVLNMTHQTNIRDECVVLFYAVRLFTGKFGPMSTKSKCREINIDGKLFFTHNMNYNLNLFNHYVKRIHNDHFLIIRFLYETEEEKEELDKIIRTLTFY